MWLPGEFFLRLEAVPATPPRFLSNPLDEWPPLRCVSTRCFGRVAIHHLLSKLERQYFYVFDYATDVTDIREQFALHLGETQEIAQELGIPHPRQIPTTDPMVMTTDFLLTFDGKRSVAVNLKHAQDLSRRRVIEKLEIERVYWKRHDVTWRVWGENELPFFPRSTL